LHFVIYISHFSFRFCNPAVFACGATLATSAAWSADVVVLRAKLGSGTITSVGEIVEYTSRQLVLTHPGGRQETIDPIRVVDIQSDWSKPHRTGDERFAAARFSEALAAYREALAAESRGWVRQRLVAQSIWCLRSLEQFEQAMDLFGKLYQQDPDTVHIDSIPLSWLTRTPPAGLERRAAELLASTASPATRLIGASWLLTATQRAPSLQALRSLRDGPDARIAFLAEAQLWRTQLPTATAEDVENWQQRRDRMPRAIQAGPTFVVAQGLARVKRPADAASMFLWVAILHPRERDLAGQSLWEAARKLQDMKDRDGSVRLYREIVERYPETTMAGEAKRAAEALRDGGHTK
jgi:tetratricopeptide (TPR) repeat protein